jgi:hypothetical protein
MCTKLPTVFFVGRAVSILKNENNKGKVVPVLN